MTLVSVAIQPARSELPARLCGLLGEQVEVVSDPDPFMPSSPWRGYREVCRRTPADATHRLILEDDALPCDGFLDAAREIAGYWPDDVVAFYVGQHAADAAHRMRVAGEACQAYVRLEQTAGWIPLVATMWPAAWARDLGEFRWPLEPRDHVADDEAAGAFLRSRGTPSYVASIPGLVQHDDDAFSTLRGQQHDGRYRRCVCWIGDFHPSAQDLVEDRHLTSSGEPASLRP